MTRTRKAQSWFVGVGLVLGGGVVIGVMADLWHAAERNRPPDREALKKSIPLDVLDPSSGAVELEGESLQSFLSQRPLAVGSRAPKLQTTDYLNRPVSVPDRAGRPTVCVVSCGCQLCAASIDRLYKLQRASGNRFNPLTLVVTESHYVWGHHANSYLWKENFRMIHDEEGTYRKQMRPPGMNPTQLPFAWACDARGVVRYAAQPRPGQDWTHALQVALGLKPVKL